MSALQHRVDQSPSPAMTGNSGPELSLLPSQPEEDFLDYQPLPRNPVVSQELIERDSTKRGKTAIELFTLENGRHYEVVTGIPEHSRSDIGVLLTTALGTSIRGHNWHTMNDLMEIGYPVTMVGPEGGYAKWPKNVREFKRFVHNLLTIDLDETSHNMHEILNETDTYGLYAPGKIIKTGESRGAGIAVAFKASSSEFDRDAIYTDAIAPCFPIPKPLIGDPELLQRAVGVSTQVASLGRHGLSMNLTRLRHYHKTANPNPHFLMNMVATVPTLVSGKAGELAKRIDKDAKIHNTHFSDDPWAYPEGWEDIFDESYPYVVNARRPGDHGAIVREDTQEDRLNRFRGLLDELESNHYRTDRINWDNVHMGGRLAVAAAA